MGLRGRSACRSGRSARSRLWSERSSTPGFRSTILKTTRGERVEKTEDRAVRHDSERIGMSASVINVKGTVMTVPCLSVESMIEMSRIVWEETRRDLLQDLEDSNASESTRMSELRQLREIKDQPLNVIRWACTPAGAKAVIEKSVGAMPDSLKDQSSQVLIQVAMTACGSDWEDMADAEGLHRENDSAQAETLEEAADVHIHARLGQPVEAADQSVQRLPQSPSEDSESEFEPQAQAKLTITGPMLTPR